MKLKYQFEKMSMDDQIMAVPVGSNAAEFSGVLRLNETASFILDHLVEDTTEEQVVDAVMDEYEGKREDIKNYVHSYLSTLTEEGILIP